VRAFLDDPPIHIRPVCSRKRGCEGQEPCGFNAFQHAHGCTPPPTPATRFFARVCRESARKRLIRFRHFCSGSLALASLDRACRNLVPAFPQRSPPRLLPAAACGGLRSAPDHRTRRALLHLSYSCAMQQPVGAARQAAINLKLLLQYSLRIDRTKRHYPVPLQLGASDNPFLEPRARHGVDPWLSARARPVTQSLSMPASPIPQTWYAYLITLPHMGITGSRYYTTPGGHDLRVTCPLGWCRSRG